jgi:hypothetical protein
VASLLALVFALGDLAAFAQTVTSANPAYLQVLEKETKSVTLYGSNLNLISSAEVILFGSPVSGVQAGFAGKTLPSLPSVDPTKGLTSLVVQITSNYNPQIRESGDCQLRLKGSKQIDIPTSILRIGIYKLRPAAVTSLRINSGEAETRNPVITLNHTVTGAPTHYRACTNALQSYGCINMATSKPYATPVTVEIPQVCNYYTAELQVMNERGGEQEKQAGISFVKDDDYPEQVRASSAHYYAKNAGFTFTSRMLDSNAEGGINVWPDSASINLWCRNKNPLLGCKCEFTLFSGKLLKEHFAYGRYQDYWDLSGAHGLPVGPQKGVTFIKKPPVGSRDLTYVIHLWIEGGTQRVDVKMEWLTMRRPCNKTWMDGF